MSDPRSQPSIVERLRSSEPLPACPFDRISPHYLTMPGDKPCPICGQENTTEGPDKCRGADTRIMGEAAYEIEGLRAKVDELTARELMILAHLYKDAPLKVANLCDDVLDQSGGLLGRVRDSARASLVNSQHQSTPEK